MVNLLDQTVLVTGASSGIGRMVAINAAQAGANLILVARNSDKLAGVKQECIEVGSEYSNHEYLSIDMADPKAIVDGVETIEDNFATVDVLVNAAGFGDFSNYLDTDFDTVEKMFQVNVLGLMLMTRLVAKQMVAAGHGHIFNVGSMAGKIATPKSAAYAASKAAVIGFSDGLRLELNPLNVWVTTVNPGPVDTNFFEVADHSGTYLQSVKNFVLDPNKLAIEIVNSFNRKKREINRPRYMELASILYKMAPSVGDYLAGTFGNRK
ncbi:SDR family NAD(P)-dependent oxidoreductase [Companilactobacillus sp.]|jgi:short-subunit dehydrogenase|uniref:SDR family NAD(P)-dependent oxidoreductase n=1 Tax=Companilactobacillus sp. TaxID=2767905 RepID=UPI0025C46404|nr:SDR family NAD(P)-dependent oxidoreductase [Companilactobacillus sp.]MCH4008337.1 SDR family NAD(P)-dependent oxidoreductase [Companilactobacillus sp.]MCH4051484.1 SDR family NAD(P)-dependent oxidoreductase [Companilactobacillus sp.]MCH4076280.1 SDR family NAD(P)-dependent oxidoreductase [Companilactobacillus sp.]MCH4124855.1 SDR family NAD(P)-dependent oxidoreductase [Companilactobacillus sp.]MCH4131397.1 SDR family NAD(P)-dependent oxidoreductase [Companilactobacillus sp.]